MKRHCLATALVVAATLPAWGHDADVIFAQVEPLNDGGFVEHLTLTADALGLLAPVDVNRDGMLTQEELWESEPSIRAGVWGDTVVRAEGQPCPLGRTRATLTPTVVVLDAEFACPAQVVEQTFRFLSVLPANFRVTVKDPSSMEGGALTAQGPMQTVMLRWAPRNDDRLAKDARRWSGRAAVAVLIGSGLLTLGLRRARRPWGRLVWPVLGGACLFAFGFWLVVSLST